MWKSNQKNWPKTGRKYVKKIQNELLSRYQENVSKKRHKDAEKDVK